MPVRKRIDYIVCYDICEPRRLVRVNRVLKRVAVPLQYSVFVGNFSARDLRRLRERLAAIIHAGEDDVRFYPLHKEQKLLQLGAESLPDEVFWSGLMVVAGDETA